MTNFPEELLHQIHASAHQVVLAITGGGSAAISRLLQVPGASRSVLEAVVPYASTALADWLGTAADQSCSDATARAMAMAAWMRARELATDVEPQNLIGLAATASLASDRPKRGDHRLHVAAQTAERTASFSLVLAKDQRSRAEEESLCSKLILAVLAEASGIASIEEDTSQFEFSLRPDETLERTQFEAPAQWTNLLLGDRSLVSSPDSLRPQAIFPGAFNPPHDGHREIVRIAEAKLGCQVAYELSITNVDKPPLDFLEIDRRLRALRGETANVAVVLTDAPTFRRKSELLPGCTFIVGADTIARVGDPKYYTGAEGSFDAAITQIADRGCRFLVFGREINGEFRVLSDLRLPPTLKSLCDEVTAEEFREDVSSTELRGHRQD